MGTWISRICLPVASLLMIYWIKRELNQRNQIQSKSETPSIKTSSGNHQMWLNRFSIGTMILCLLTLLFCFFHTVPYLCEYTDPLQQIFWVLSQYSLTFYQITRLSYCFSSEQVHSDKYGYSKHVFIILHCFGILLTIYTIVMQYLIWNTISVPEFGCALNQNTELFNQLVPILLLWYLIWDITVLVLYLIKICQIGKHKRFKHPSIYRKIRFILHKIVFLTILYEIKGIFPPFSFFFFNRFQIRMHSLNI